MGTTFARATSLVSYRNGAGEVVPIEVCWIPVSWLEGFRENVSVFNRTFGIFDDVCQAALARDKHDLPIFLDGGIWLTLTELARVEASWQSVLVWLGFLHADVRKLNRLISKSTKSIGTLRPVPQWQINQTYRLIGNVRRSGRRCQRLILALNDESHRSPWRISADTVERMRLELALYSQWVAFLNGEGKMSQIQLAS